MGFFERSKFRGNYIVKPQEQEKLVVSLTPELEQQLRDFYAAIRPQEEGKGPLGCIDASELAVERFPLKFQGGSFLLDSAAGPMTVPDLHAWVEDADGVVIDFLRHQYNSRLPANERIPLDMLPIIHPGDKGYARYATASKLRERRLLRTPA